MKQKVKHLILLLVDQPSMHAWYYPRQVVVSEALKAACPGETAQSQTNQDGWSTWVLFHKIHYIYQPTDVHDAGGIF